jgi:two-component system OmpR family sensor kinase
MAQSDAGRLALRIEPLDTADLLASTASRFEWRAQETGRRIALDPGGETSLRGDRVRLEQALGNLIDNALRHGGGDVELSAAGANGTVELHVADHGPGLPADFVDRAFERFTRADVARGHGGGSGLGLSIVRMIAEAHGGAAHVRNREGGGTDVWVTLPAAGP